MTDIAATPQPRWILVYHPGTKVILTQPLLTAGRVRTPHTVFTAETAEACQAKIKELALTTPAAHQKS